MTDRYYVTLTATCASADLPEVLADMQAAQRDLAGGAAKLDGLSLSFSRDDAEEFSAETVSLPDASTPAPIVPDAPPAGPVTSTGPGAPPPDALPPIDAEDGQHAAPEEQA